MHIVVLGYIVRGPLGGLSWHHLQYVLGLKQLGHNVLFLEDSDDFPGCYNPDTFEVTENPQYGLQFIKDLFNSFDLDGHWGYYDAHQGNWFGKTQQQVSAFCAKSDIVFNLSAVNPARDWWTSIPCRVFVDTDPGFIQIRHLTDPGAKALALLHNRFFSFAENIGDKSCTIPDDGIQWRATRQPLYLQAWKTALSRPTAKWTTVMQWDSYKEKEYKGQTFGMKSKSFQSFIDLPKLVLNETFELALGGTTAPVDQLTRNGWGVISSLIPTKSPWTYQQYIKQSKGEWSVAKHGYVVSNSGWFSERSACYLASGKPVVIQETGFSNKLQTGNGLFAFTTLEESIDALNKVAKDYEYHCKEARKLAEEAFESDVVLNQLLQQL
jgi:hypothetical protein